MDGIDEVRRQLRQERARQLREENERAREELERQAREREFLEEMGQPQPESREWKLPEPEPPPRQRQRDTSPVDWSGLIDQRIAAERAFMREVIGEVLADLADRQCDAIDDAVRPMKAELAELKVTIAEVRLANAELRVQQSVDQGSKGILDLPPMPLRSSRAN